MEGDHPLIGQLIEAPPYRSFPGRPVRPCSGALWVLGDGEEEPTDDWMFLSNLSLSLESSSIVLSLGGTARLAQV
ncbi:MAG: hypothetical protein ACLP62_15035 [Acidimicrobiales bacterium]